MTRVLKLRLAGGSIAATLPKDMAVFLGPKGLMLKASETDVATMRPDLAPGTLDDRDFGAWLRQRTFRNPPR